MTQPNEYYAYFTLVGDFDPEEITMRLGTDPTDCWQKGSINERTHFERKFSRWSLYSRLPRTMQVEAHVRDVVEQIRPLSPAILELRKLYQGEVPVVAHLYEGYPGVHIAADLLLELGKLSLDLDFDFYFMYSDKREDS